MSNEFYWPKGFPKEFWLSTYEFENGAVIARLYLTKKGASNNTGSQKVRKYKFVEVKDAE